MSVPIESGPRRRNVIRAFSLITVAVATATAPVMADAFGPVRYDPKSDQLIITMIVGSQNLWTPPVLKFSKPFPPFG
jgi:hypothetical protein